MIAVIIRDGVAGYASAATPGFAMYRNLVWGEAAFERWVSEFDAADRDDFSESESLDDAIFVDHDGKRIFYPAEQVGPEHPRVIGLVNRLITAAWPGYTVVNSYRDAPDLLTHTVWSMDDWLEDRDDVDHDTLAGLIDAYRDEEYEDDDQYEDDDDQYEDDDSSDRGLIVTDVINANPPAAGTAAAAADTPAAAADTGSATIDLTEPVFDFDDDDDRVWVTVIEPAGTVRHRQLPALPADVLDGDPDAIALLLAMPADDVPDEAVTLEGLIIDQSRPAVYHWSAPGRAAHFSRIQSGGFNQPSDSDGYAAGSNDGYAVESIDGYDAHCRLTGPAGTPMSDAQALGKVFPLLVSTKVFDLSGMVDAIGGKIKRVAVLGTGCALVAINFPVLLFGLISGNLRAAAITIAVVTVIGIVLFQIAKVKFRRRFDPRKNESAQDDGGPPPVAGPIDETERRAELDRRLKAAGLPSIAAAEPYREQAFDLLGM